MTQIPFVQCPVCGGEMVEKDAKGEERGNRILKIDRDGLIEIDISVASWAPGVL